MGDLSLKSLTSYLRGTGLYPNIFHLYFIFRSLANSLLLDSWPSSLLPYYVLSAGLPKLPFHPNSNFFDLYLLVLKIMGKENSHKI